MNFATIGVVRSVPFTYHVSMRVYFTDSIEHGVCGRSLMCTTSVQDNMRILRPTLTPVRS